MDVLARLDEARAATERARAPLLPALERRRAERRASSASTPGEYRHAVARSREPPARAPRPSRPLGRHAAEGLRAPRRGGDRATSRCGSSSRGRCGATARTASRAPTLAETAGVRAARGPPGRICSSTSPCCTRSRPASPEISQTKLEGLRAHYGYIEEGPATEYFSVHELRDVEHARAGGRADRRADAESEDPEAAERGRAMVARAEQALRGQLGAARRRRRARASCSAGAACSVRARRARRTARRRPRSRG